MGRTPRREVEDQVLDSLLSWVNTVSQLNREVADHVGVAVSDLDCLHMLRLRGPSTAAELARHVGLTPGSLSRMIDRLDAAGCIKRASDSQDRRRVQIEPTKEGLKRIATYYDSLTKRTHKDLSAFRTEELHSLLRFIERSRLSVSDELMRLRDSKELF